MSAHTEADDQYNATGAERASIVQELHDTLLQGFTGIGLKLEALTHGLPASLVGEKEQLKRMLEQSDEYLVEARRAVWELRSPSLQQPGNLSEALKRVSKRALDGTNIQLRFSTSGAPRKLTQVIEDNFLRICEEAVRNALQH